MYKKRLFPQLRNYFSIINIKLMKAFKTLNALILGAPTLFSISSAYSGTYSIDSMKNEEIECISNDKKCIDLKEKELVFKVEA